MHVLLGYLLCLVVLTPAFSIDVFFALIGATSRLHDLLAMVRAISRMMLSVTSPFKIALTLFVLFGVFAAESDRRTRGFALVMAGILGLAAMLQAGMLTGFGGLTATAIAVPWIVAVLASLWSGSRLLSVRSY